MKAADFSISNVKGIVFDIGQLLADLPIELAKCSAVPKELITDIAGWTKKFLNPLHMTV